MGFELDRFDLHKGSIDGWGWKRLYLPSPMLKKNSVVVPIVKLKLIHPKGLDCSRIRGHPTVFITGDGDTLASDVKEFELWGVPHDLYAVNRSLIFHERQVDHWAAVDLEETMWFTQNVNEKVEPYKHILRHTISDLTSGADIHWEMVFDWEHENQKLIFAGNSGYFALLTAIHMGYEKIVIAGMPLNTGPHWYENTKDYIGPNWSGATYRNWMDFKMKVPEAEKVRSMSGYSAFILGQATKEWVL